MNAILVSPLLRSKMGRMFVGHFHSWEDFSRDIVSHRDMNDISQAREEKIVVDAVDILADLVGRSHNDLRGFYYQVQNGGAPAGPARDKLIRNYDEVAREFGGIPSPAR